MLEPNDVVHVLDLCDRATGERAERGHRFAWLLTSVGPEAEPARVDAWYPARRWAVDVRESHDDEELHRRARIVRAYGLEYAVVDTGGLERDPQGRLRRTGDDAARIAAQLEWTEVRERQRLEWGGPEGFVFGANIAGLVDLPEEEWDEDDEDDEEEWEEDEEDELAEHVALGEGRERRGGEDADWHGGEEASRWRSGEELDDGLTVAEMLGWRGRSIADALLGAVALARRGLSVDVTGRGRAAIGLDVLLLLALVEPVDGEAHALGMSPKEMATVLALDAHAVRWRLDQLAADGHVERTGHPAEQLDEWAITLPGVRVVLDWLGRASPLFGGWPPDPGR